MNSPTEFDLVYENIITKHQLADVMLKLRMTHEAVFKQQSSSQRFLEDQLPSFMVEYILFASQKHKINLEDKNETQELINSIIQMLEKTPIVEIKIAVLPTYRTVQKIVAWWREWTHLPLIVAINIDEQIVIGAQISYNGTFADYSCGRWIGQKGAAFIEQTFQ